MSKHARSSSGFHRGWITRRSRLARLNYPLKVSHKPDATLEHANYRPCQLQIVSRAARLVSGADFTREHLPACLAVVDIFRRGIRGPLPAIESSILINRLNLIVKAEQHAGAATVLKKVGKRLHGTRRLKDLEGRPDLSSRYDSRLCNRTVIQKLSSTRGLRIYSQVRNASSPSVARSSKGCQRTNRYSAVNRASITDYRRGLRNKRRPTHAGK